MHDCAFDKGPIAYFYWIFFQLFAFFVFLNVFIAIIVEEFQNVNQVESTLEVIALKQRDINTFIATWGKFNPLGQHYMPTTKFTEFMLALPPPLGYYQIDIGKVQLDKVIFCLNIRDHEGYVYFPEVMWAIFFSIIGKNDEKLVRCKPMKNVMTKVKNKFVGLNRNTSLDQLCGNKFYRTEMTITKYLTGRLILDKMRILLKRKMEREQGKGIILDKTSIYLKNERAKAMKKDYFLAQVWRAIT